MKILGQYCWKYIFRWNWKKSIAIEIKRILDEQNIKVASLERSIRSNRRTTIIEKFGKTFINKSRVTALKNAVSESFKVAIFDDGLKIG